MGKEARQELVAEMPVGLLGVLPPGAYLEAGPLIQPQIAVILNVRGFRA